MIEKKVPFFKIKKIYLNFLKKQEKGKDIFYDKLGQLKNFYIPICYSIYKWHLIKKKVLVIGLSGGQGSGKTTITEIIKIILKKKYNLNVISFSIDDFYKTHKQRKEMSKKIHRLFLTRGVPGTHDLKLLKRCFASLFKKNFKSFLIPKFDKSKDDRLSKNKWTKVKKRPDILIFEGWCLGAKHQTKKKLNKITNLLEKNYDKRLIWRTKVNNELKKRYKKIFRIINKLIFLEAPNFDYIYKWRLLQEKKLAKNKSGKKIMSKSQIKNFIMHYERITRQMLIDLKSNSNVVVKIDKRHKLSKIKFN